MLDAVLAADAAARAWLATWFEWPPLDPLVAALGVLGFWGAIFALLAVAYAWRSRGLAAMATWRLVVALALTVAVVDLAAKPLVARPRPYVADPATRVVGLTSATWSFPSGHAATAVAGAIGLSLVWPRRRRWWWSLAVLVAASRVYNGVHYPLDIAGGALVGWACARAVTVRTPAAWTGRIVGRAAPSRRVSPAPDR
jgi:undecaprenyl-diphosphatase